MSCSVCLMRREDIAQVTEIDREAFPTLWPPTNYRNELTNRLARYIVACDKDKTVALPEEKAAAEKVISGLTSRLKWFLHHDLFSANKALPSVTHYIMGFAGLWLMAGEAHITNIAVREMRRRQGIGELLLISLVDLAIEMDASLVTLEVRFSNTAAQQLYYKYGFVQVGLRRGYYIDDKEDAMLMTVEGISSATYKSRLNELKRAYSRKWGRELYGIAR